MGENAPENNNTAINSIPLATTTTTDMMTAENEKNKDDDLNYDETAIDNAGERGSARGDGKEVES